MGAGNETNSDEAAASGELIHAPRGVGISLAVFVVALVGVALYLVAVRREALFVDLAGLSGLLFCF